MDTIRQRKTTAHATTSNVSGEETIDQNQEKDTSKSSLSWIYEKWDNILWLLGAVLCLWYFNVPMTVLFNKDIDRGLLLFSILSWLVFVGIGAYFIIYIGRVKGIQPNQWMDLYPKLFPVATGSFLASCCIFGAAVWPVWGIYSVAILVTSCMGVIVVISML